MNQRTQYFIQVLEKIGTPLLSAIISGAPSTDASGQEDARKMAALLSKSVETSISFGQMIDVNSLGENGDRVRVAMMALAANLVGESYKLKQQMPGETENKRMVAALQAALTFSENFTPSPENTKALENLEAKGHGEDIYQAQVQYIQAFVPVISAITEFSFGHKEPKLMTEIASRLIARAEDIAKGLNHKNETHRKAAELGVLRALAELYATCHRAEISRVMKMSEDERVQRTQESGGLALDAIWKDFDLRVSLVEALTQNILGASSVTSSTSTKAPAPPPSIPVAPPASAPPQAEVPKPQIFQAPSPPPTQTPPTVPASSPAQTGANPMSMFAKKPADSTPPPAPPAQTEAPKPETPPAPPAQNQTGNTGGNPMSFFKSPPKDDGET